VKSLLHTYEGGTRINDRAIPHFKLRPAKSAVKDYRPKVQPSGARRSAGMARTEMQASDSPDVRLTAEADQPPPPLPLPQGLDLTGADALHGSLQSCLERDVVLRIDGSAVELVSTACLQVMVAAAMTARGRGGEFELMAPSRPLRDAARDLGLSPALGLEDS
jgi:anti-anti-sigma regulatory factor